MHDEVAQLTAPKTTAAAAWSEQAPRVRRYLRFLGADLDTVDDLVQEALLAALRSFGGAGAPLPWLLTTARHALAQHLRRLGRRREVLDLERHDVAWHEQAGDDGGDAQRAALEACLQALPERTRHVLAQRYRHGASRLAIANAVGMGEQGVKSLLARARAALGECMQRRLGTQRRLEHD